MGAYIGVLHALHSKGQQLDVARRQLNGSLGVGGTDRRRHDDGAFEYGGSVIFRE